MRRLQQAVHSRLVRRRARRLIAQVRRQRLTYLSPARLEALAERCLAHEREGLPGIVVEAGCALGGSSIVLAATKAPRRALRVFDVFGRIPPPTAEDGEDVHARYRAIRSGRSPGIGGDCYYGYVDDLYERVIASFERLGYPVKAHNVSLERGLLQDTLHVDEPVSLAHIDVDWYDSVKTCLERIEPRLVPGGSLILDDYLDWSSCRRAVDEYFAGRDPAHFAFDGSRGSLIITRRRGTGNEQALGDG